MSLAPVVSPYQPINGLTGLGLNNGFLYIGVDGTDPETYPQACFWDAAGAIPATQPIDILGGYPMRLGTPTRLYTASTYSIRVRDATGSQVFYEAHAVPNAASAVGVYGTRALAAAAIIPVNVQASGLMLLGYAVAGDAGAGALYRYSAAMPSHLGRFQSADGAWWELISNPLKIGMFGSGLTAWQAAASVMNAGVSDTLIIPAGVYQIQRAGLANPLTDGLITFTNSAGIRFEPGAEVQFDYIALPLFCFAGCTRGGITGQPRFKFTGVTPAATVCTRAQYSAASGFAFSSWVGGGDYELFTMILSNSSNVTFENISLESATPNDEGHCVPVVFNIRPTSPTVRTSGVRVRNVTLRDFMFGVLYTQQDSFVLQNIDGDRRAGLTTSGIGPGHLIYSSGLGTGVPNINCVVDGVRDGPNAINWPASIAQNLGTFAYKEAQFCEVVNVRSYHPAGIIQTLQSANDCDFIDWAWRTTDTNSSGVSPLNMVHNNARNRFVGFRIYCPGKVFSVAQDASGVWTANLFDDWFISSKMDLGVGAPPTGLFDFYGSQNIIRNVRLNPQGGIVGTPQNAATTRGGVGVSSANLTEITFVGSTTPKQRRYSEGGGNSWARVGQDVRATDQNYLNNDALPYAVANGTIIETGTQATRGYTVDTGIAGAETVTFQLPGRGMFLVTVDVENNGRTARMGASYLVSFANQASVLHDAQIIGAAYSVAAEITLLAVTCNENGGLFVSYTKSAAFFATVSLSWLRIGAIAD